VSDVVISGVGAVSAYGTKMDDLREGLLSGVRRFAPFHALISLQAPAYPVAACAALPFSSEEARSTQMALLAAKEAIAHLDPEERKDTAVILGGTTGGMVFTEACSLDAPFAGLASFDHRVASAHPVSDATERVARFFHLGGPQSTIVSACSSGLNAVIWGKRFIDAGMVRRVLAIGTDALCRLTVVGFASLSAIDPSGARPFQRERKGITIGEGAAAFLLEREADARAAKRHVRARVLGGAVIGEAHHITQPDPTGEGALRAMRNALNDAKLERKDIDAVSAHGTATPHNDAMESRALRELFSDRVPVSSQKSQLGHTLGAAGALELAACLLMLDAQHVFPTFGLTEENLDPECAGLMHVMNAPLKTPIRHLMKNSFAFGGQNSVLVLGSAA
jgi:3-oxoacyl-[acyl-carrier-protein] synthase II